MVRLILALLISAAVTGCRDSVAPVPDCPECPECPDTAPGFGLFKVYGATNIGFLHPVARDTFEARLAADPRLLRLFGLPDEPDRSLNRGD